MYRNVLLLLFFACISGQHLLGQQLETSVILFALDSDELRPDAQLELDQLLSRIGELDRWELEVRAHTDATGTAVYNEALALRRAASVREYLVQRDLPETLIRISTFGEHRPVESNLTEDGRQRNRRVEIDLHYWGLEGLQDLIGSLSDDPSQHFRIPADQSVAITGADGTTIWIPSDLFVRPDGSAATGIIDLELREAYTYADMLLQGLSTHSGDQLLETGGMIYLEARSGSEQLQIREGGQMIIGMPTEEPREGMQLFTGNVDANGNLLDWEPTGQEFKTEKLATLRIADPPAMPEIRTELTLFRLDESGEPTPPTAPREPIYPKEPNRESIQYNPGFFKKLTLGKKGIEAREEAIYEQKMAQYRERLERYPEQMERYRQQLDRYEAQLQNYREAKTAYEAGLQAQWQAHQERQREKYKDALAEAEAKYRRTLQAYEEYKARKIAAYEAAVEQGPMDQYSLKKYFFAVNKLGWINCDRFYAVPDSDKEELLVRDKDEQEEMIFILFNDTRSALRTIRGEGFYRTQAVPTGASVKVIGLKVRDGQSLLAVQDVVIGDQEQVELDYQPRRLSEIRETMASLD